MKDMVNHIKKITLTLLFFSSVIISGAQNLDDYMKIAAENNPGLKSKFNEYLAALERIPQAGALPDPQISFGLFIMPMEKYMGDQIFEVSVMQMFPWIGTLEAAQNEYAYKAKAKYEDFNQAKSELFYQIKVTWYALYLLEKEIEVTKENVELLKSMEQIATIRFKSGGQTGKDNIMTGASDKKTKSTNDAEKILDNMRSGTSNMKSVAQQSGMASGGLIDVLLIQLSINELKNNIELLKERKIPLEARFNQLLNKPLNENIVLPDSLSLAEMPVVSGEINDKIQINNPVLKSYVHKEAAFVEMRNMNRKMGLPKFGIGLQYNIFRPRQNSESSMNGKNMLMPMATVSIPIWRSKYNASIREAEFLRKTILEKKTDMSNMLEVEYSEAINDFKNAERRYYVNQEQISIANQALNIILVDYSTNSAEFEDVLKMQERLLDYKLKQIQAIIDSYIAVAKMEKILGH